LGWYKSGYSDGQSSEASANLYKKDDKKSLEEIDPSFPADQ
jgi:hypothetical protein